VYTVRAAGNGDIGARIHKYPGALRIWQRQRRTHELAELAGRHFFLADLDAFHAFGKSVFNGFQHSPTARDAVAQH
jgi:hypothetical protein